jgi:group I intron endonuclease
VDIMREKICGIYCIENTINHKKYIGQSNDIHKRWNSHRRELKNQNHGNKYFQREWNKYGKENFLFYILEVCKEAELDNKEIFYINKFSTYVSGYNLTTGGEGRRGYHLTEEQKNTIKNSRPNFKHSEETKKYISKIQTGRKLPDEWKDHISISHKKRIASGDIIPNIINLLNYNEKCKTPIKCYDSSCKFIAEFSDIHTAARELKVEATNICKVLKGKHKTCGGYTFIYSNEEISDDELTKRFNVDHSKDRHSSNCEYINLIDNSGNVIKAYENTKVIADELGVDRSSVIKVCRGKLNQTKGYRFAYAS